MGESKPKRYQLWKLTGNAHIVLLKFLIILSGNLTCIFFCYIIYRDTLIEQLF